jgi:hypothetical protein
MNVSSSEWRIWMAWLLVGIPGGVLALAVAAETPPWMVGFARSGNEADTSGYAVGWAVVLAGALTGASLGAVQRLVLRKRLPNLVGWVWASSAGFGLAFTVVWAVGGLQHGNLAHHAVPHAVDLAGPVGGAAIGAVFGAFQWLVLRRHVRRAGWWVPANSVGFGAGWVLAAATPVDGVLAHFVGGGIVGAVVAFTTGAVLLWLLRRPRTDRRPDRAAYIPGQPVT